MIKAKQQKKHYDMIYHPKLSFKLAIIQKIENKIMKWFEI